VLKPAAAAALAAVVLVGAATGCGKRARTSASPETTTAGTETQLPAATETSAVTTSAGTATGTTSTVSPATTTKAGYERAMQARMDVFAAQCLSPDPGVAARQTVARWRLAVRQLAAIEPPAAVATAHQTLIAVTRAYLRTAVRRIAPSDRLSALIRRARADGRITDDEQTLIRNRQNDLLLQYLVPTSVGKRQGDVLRAFLRRGYAIEPKGPPKPEYVRRVQTLVDAAGNPRKSIRDTAEIAGAGGLLAQLRRLRDAAWRSARAVDDITAADRVSEAQRKLIGALCDRGRLYDDLAQGLEAHPTAVFRRAAEINGRDADRIGGDLYRGALEDYRAAGYRIHAATGPPP
jgi:hypothetical protein